MTTQQRDAINEALAEFNQTGGTSSINSVIHTGSTTVELAPESAAIEVNLSNNHSTANGEGDDALAKALAAMALMATVTAGVVIETTASSQNRQSDVIQQRAEKEAALQDALAQQQIRAEENAAANEAMRQKAQEQVFLEARQSEANKQYWAAYAAAIAEMQRRAEEAAQQSEMMVVLTRCTVPK